MVRQETNGPVWEHLVIEFAKVDQPCSTVVGLGGDSRGAAPSIDCETDGGGLRFALRSLQHYADPNRHMY